MLFYRPIPLDHWGEWQGFESVDSDHVGVAGVPYRTESIVRLKMRASKLRAGPRLAIGARAMSGSTLTQRKSEVAIEDEGMTDSDSRGATAIRHKKTNNRNASTVSTSKI